MVAKTTRNFSRSCVANLNKLINQNVDFAWCPAKKNDQYFTNQMISTKNMLVSKACHGLSTWLRDVLKSNTRTKSWQRTPVLSTQLRKV